MVSWLNPDLTTIAFCWRIARHDGVTLGFTSHDRDLWRDGLCYKATPGMVPSAIERSVSLAPDNMELSGALTSDAISEIELAAGHFDGAGLQLFVCDWEAPEGEIVPMVRGQLGSVQMAGDKFSAELNGPTTELDAPVVEFTSPDCRAALGDKRCGVDMAGRILICTISSASGNIVSLNGLLLSGDYVGGRMRWLSGLNAGQSTAIVANGTGTCTVAELPFYAINSGDQIELVQGCDRRFSTCRDRFANATNFRGEPHLPGNDLLTRYVSG
jgi:uncharacterized phage protein (TIGR02218 family)